MICGNYVDIGIAYPWVRPPQEVYSGEVGGRPNIALEAFTGGSVIYEGFAGDMDYVVQAYGGEAGLDTGGTLSKMIGAKVKFSSDIFTVIGGFNRHMPEGATAEGGASADKNNHDVSVISVGTMLNLANTLVMAEYVKGTVADLEDLDTTAYYATLGYQLGDFI